MSRLQDSGHLCPMHPEIRQAMPGKCPQCSMDLLPEGARFGMLRHVARSPLMMTVMVAIMVVAMAAIMMFR